MPPINNATLRLYVPDGYQVLINNQLTKNQSLGGIHRGSRIFSLEGLQWDRVSHCEIVVMAPIAKDKYKEYHRTIAVHAGQHFTVHFHQGFHFVGVVDHSAGDQKAGGRNADSEDADVENGGEAGDDAGSVDEGVEAVGGGEDSIDTDPVDDSGEAVGGGDPFGGGIESGGDDDPVDNPGEAGGSGDPFSGDPFSGDPFSGDPFGDDGDNGGTADELFGP